MISCPTSRFNGPELAVLAPAAERGVSGTGELADLVHEVWVDGEGLPGLCLAGPAGDGFRSQLDAAARLVHVFEGPSHFGAMETYNGFLGREPYSTNDKWALESYPEEWRAEQKVGEAEWRALHRRWLSAR